LPRGNNYGAIDQGSPFIEFARGLGSTKLDHGDRDGKVAGPDAIGLVLYEGNPSRVRRRRLPMPTEQSVRLNDMHGLLPKFGKAGKKDKQEVVLVAKLRSFDLPMQEISC